MRRAFAVVMVGMLLVLTACTGLPTAGPVQPGNQPGSGTDVRPYALVPDPPLDGASPQQIVESFLRAGSGPQGEWATARLYLTTDFAKEWRPQEGVTIDRLADRTPPALALPSSAGDEAATGVVLTQRIIPEATVAPNGEYSPSDGSPVPLEFHLVQEDGQWRIAEAPDGVVLYEEDFELAYQAANLMFFDPTWTYLVPDVRWFPRPLIATRVAQALIDGEPSSWLADAVVTAFRDDITLVGNAVPVPAGEALVELNSAAFGLEPLTLDRMQTQLRASLGSIDVSAVQMSVGTTPLDAEEVPVRATRVDTSPLVELVDGDFGFLGADSFTLIPGLSNAVEATDAQSVAVDPERRNAAVLTTTGAVVRANDDGTVDALDVTSQGLAAPSIDSYGTIWSVPREDPDAFTAYPATGETLAVAVPWSNAARLAAFQVSRDGSRLAAAVTAGGRTEVWIAGISRTNGTPTALSEPQVLASSSASALDLSWLDDTSLGVLLVAGDTTTLLRQPVAGRGRSTTVPSTTALEVSGGNSSVRLRTSEGVLLVERGTNWEESARDVAVLAVQQGQPQ